MTPRVVMRSFGMTGRAMKLSVMNGSDRILVIFEGQIMGEYSGKNPPIEEISLAMTGK